MAMKVNYRFVMAAILILTLLPSQKHVIAETKTSSATTGTNVALGKKVTITTNGANDKRENPGQYPSDVTDGSLEYKPASWAQEDGVVGFVNDDYSQMMEIYIHIDLGGPYHITGIRYNMGNVQFGDKWMADSVTTPLGTFTPIPGGSYVGAWTDQTGNATQSSVDITLKKTRINFYTDWLFIGEIEVYAESEGAPVFDLPLNYPGRGNPTEQQFLTSWQNCVSSFLDHQYPFAVGTSGDGILVTFWNGHYSDPVNKTCTSFYNCYDGHEGYDLALKSSCGGTAIYPVAAGTVVSAFCDRDKDQKYQGYGCQVKILHGTSGYQTLYGHMLEDSVFATTKTLIGKQVTKDTVIGTMGSTGNSTGTHLHLSTYYQGKIVDPSGWQSIEIDPYVRDRSGPVSQRLWVYSPQRDQIVTASQSNTFVSPSNQAVISFPPQSSGQDFALSVTEIAPTFLPSGLASGGHALEIDAVSLDGQTVITEFTGALLTFRFSDTDLTQMRAGTIGIYRWDEAIDEWILLQTQITLPSLSSNDLQNSISTGEVTATVDKPGYYALLGDALGKIYLPLISR